jgi:hypothetical protein
MPRLPSSQRPKQKKPITYMIHLEFEVAQYSSILSLAGEELPILFYFIFFHLLPAFPSESVDQ